MYASPSQLTKKRRISNPMNPVKTKSLDSHFFPKIINCNLVWKEKNYRAQKGEKCSYMLTSRRILSPHTLPSNIICLLIRSHQKRHQQLHQHPKQTSAYEEQTWTLNTNMAWQRYAETANLEKVGHDTARTNQWIYRIFIFSYMGTYTHKYIYMPVHTHKTSIKHSKLPKLCSLYFK